MPIRPENKALYPADWPAIARACKERAGWRCEHCGVAHGAIGYRLADGAFVRLGGSWLEAERAAEDARAEGRRVIRIVLTCAHLVDMNPAACEPSNLAALCQRCHNHHDLAFRQANRIANARVGRAHGDLFEEPNDG